jgi:hypothetical protein
MTRSFFCVRTARLMLRYKFPESPLTSVSRETFSSVDQTAIVEEYETMRSAPG